MKKNILKYIIVFVMALVILSPSLALATSLDPWGDVDASETQDLLGLGNKDPREIAAGVINILLGFLGIVAVVIILIGGFKWMTAGGNEDKTAEARKLITAGIIGLVIILAAFAIAKFVIDQLLSATGAV
jgi:hypothetical protein